MSYKDIKTLTERRKENSSTPTHIMQRYEIEELREYIEEGEDLVKARMKIELLMNCLKKAEEHIKRFEENT